jgi:hypothetical protein
MTITAASNVYFNGNIYPGFNDTYTLGSRYQRWKNIYTSNTSISPGTLYLDNGSNDEYVKISSTGQVISANISGSYLSSIPGVNVNQNAVFAVGNDTTYPVKYSTEGSVWCNVPTSISINPIYDIAYDGRSTWVMSGQFTNMSGGGFASGDGSQWNDVPITENVFYDPGPANAVCFCGGDGRWYSVGVDACGANTILRSESYDEQKWSSSVDIFSGSACFLSGEGRSVAWDGNTTVVACGSSSESNSAIMWTNVIENGQMWYNSTYSDLTSITADARWVSYNGTQWMCAAGAFGVLSSLDGKVWVEAYSLPGFTAKCVEWNGQNWLMGGSSPSTVTPTLYYSADGSNWTPVFESVNWSFRSVVWNGTNWIVGDGAVLRKSSNVQGPWVDTTFGDNTFTDEVNNLANTSLLPNAPVSPGQALLSGEGAPSVEIGKIGDIYTDTTNGYVYGPKEVLSWGDPAIPRSLSPQTFYGAGVPETDPPGSRPGDYYVDTETEVRYVIY